MSLSAKILLVFFMFHAGLVRAQILTPVWTEVGDRGTVVRVVVNSPQDCPEISVDGVIRRMSVRRPIPAGLRPACEARIPASAQTVSVQGKALALPHPNPSQVVVIGDTGCRIKGAAVQDCNDPAKWPFRRVAGLAAESKPQLVIHVGDYLYREMACPPEAQAKCAGTPVGDTWEAWNADFFEPAAQLLAAAPWAFARGNHEDCQRSWRGWFYYLDPRPFGGKCDAFSKPYLVRLGAFELVMFDSATAAADREGDPEGFRHYSSELAHLHADHAWFVLHHPVWGLRPGNKPNSAPVETSSNVTKAWEDAPPKGIDMILSGHTHLFELLSFDGGRPVQLVAGDGGTEMAMPVPARVSGLSLKGATLISAQDAREFGYTTLRKAASGWQLTLTSTAGRVIESATVPIH